MTEERRQDDKMLAVLIQKVDDFMDTSTSAQKEVLKEIKELRERAFNLPCRVHEQRLNDMGSAVIGLWVICGAIGIGLLTELIRFWSK